MYDHFKTKLPKETIIHVWKPDTNVTEVLANGNTPSPRDASRTPPTPPPARAGYNVLRNVGYHDHSWYLDNLDADWADVYGNEPCVDVPTDALCARLLGGHGELWGEKVDSSDLQQTAWPRLAAIAEKLWSPRAATSDVSAQLPRMLDFRCLLNERGVAAAPVLNKMAREGPPSPGSCYEQRRRRK